MITKDGYKIIFFTGLLEALLLAASCIKPSVALWIVTGIIGVLFIFHFFFFRDPQRKTPDGDALIISPADGTIIKIDEIEEPVYLKEKVRRVAIFMSVFNAHINRNPVDGTVEFLEHKNGQFLAAFADKALDVNERTEIGVTTKFGKVFFVQIAGLIARRIVCRLKPGDTIKPGERFGMIKYSSRVDLFLPLSAKINVSLKDKVRAGETIIGEFTS